jgi:hypothetical protein
MPKQVRKCLRFPLVIAELARYPLLEELELLPLKAADGAHSACEKSSRFLKKLAF